jgi:hypothetical protein
MFLPGPAVAYYGAKMGCQDPDDIPGNTAYWFFVFFWQTEGYNHYGSIFVHFRSPGELDIHVIYLKMFVHVSAL